MESTNAHVKRNDGAFASLVAHEAEHYRWQEQKVAAIERVLRGLGARGALADVGCFTGLATARFRDLGFERAVGLDASPSALARAAERGIEPRAWRAGAEPCPAQDGEFDVVVAADIIEHIVDSDAFVLELRRVLRPGGALVVTTPNLAFWLSRLRLLIGKVPWSSPGASATVREDFMVDLNHIRVTTRREWEALFRAHGFEVEKVQGWSLLHALGSSPSVRLRQTLDRWLVRVPDLAFGLLFVLRLPG